MATIRDIIEGQIRRDRDGNVFQDRVFVVADGSGSAAARMWNALNAPGVPVEREPHPVIPRVVAMEIDCNPMDGDPATFVVTAHYEDPEPKQGGEDEAGTRVSWTYETVEETTIRDVFGNLMQTHWARFGFIDPNVGGVTDVTVHENITTTTTSSGGTSAVTNLTTRTHRVAVDRFIAVARVSRTLRDLSARTLNERYQGRTNALPWAGYDVGRVLCRGFTSDQQDRNLHDVTGVFAVAPHDVPTWDVEVIASDATGKIPENVAAGNGIEEYQIYERTDLNASGFSVPGA